MTAVLCAKTELLRQAAKVLLEKETLTGVELQAIAAGQVIELPDTSREPVVATGTRPIQETGPAHEVRA